MADSDNEERDEGTEEEEETQEQESDEQQKPEHVELEKLRNALKKANGEAAKFRNELKSLRTQNEDDAQKAVREAQEAVVSKYSKMIVQAEARAQLVEMGLTGKPELFLRLIDFDAVGVGDDGSVEGLKDQLLTIKSDFAD